MGTLKGMKPSLYQHPPSPREKRREQTRRRGGGVVRVYPVIAQMMVINQGKRRETTPGKERTVAHNKQKTYLMRG